MRRNQTFSSSAARARATIAVVLTALLALLALTVFAAASPAGATALPQPVFERHTDGSIWELTGTVCTTTPCGGRVMLDNNPATMEISANWSTVYQEHFDHSVWRWTGKPCVTSSNCPGWVRIDDNPATVSITAGSGTVYQHHADGSIWRANGTVCSGDFCPGWVEIDNDPRFLTMTVGAGTVFELLTDGTVWRSTGAACLSPASCSGWTLILPNPVPGGGQELVAGGSQLYERHEDGSIWQWTGGTTWVLLDNNPETGDIAAGANSTLYQLHNTHVQTIWSLTGAGWSEWDANGSIWQIFAGATNAYQRHYDDSIWRSTGAACGNGCGGWVLLDNDPNISTVSVSNGS